MAKAQAGSSTRKSKPLSPGTETRNAAWQRTVAEWKQAHDAGIESHALTQEWLATAVEGLQRLGIDLRALTALHRAAFEKIVRDAPDLAHHPARVPPA